MTFQRAALLLTAAPLLFVMQISAMKFDPPSEQLKKLGETFKCLITAKRCENYPQFSNQQFPDSYGLQFLDVGAKASFCLRR